MKDIRKYYKEIDITATFLQGIYRGLRLSGFDRAESKKIIETALKCAMVDEAMIGIDREHPLDKNNFIGRK